MLFNSYEFVLIFLPITLAGYFVAGRFAPIAALSWLIAASLLFHAWWDWHATIVLIASIACNYAAVTRLVTLIGDGKMREKKILLYITLSANLSLLLFYKYLPAFYNETLLMAGIPAAAWRLELPLGISFFTFTQIAYLVDIARGGKFAAGLIRYCVFITYFPHLVAGPLLHHADIMPQFELRSNFRPDARKIAVGATTFVLGLFKKVWLADEAGYYADFAFNPANQANLEFAGAWSGALAYSLQIYLDFSAYTDMAIGLADRGCSGGGFQQSTSKASQMERPSLNHIRFV